MRTKRRIGRKRERGFTLVEIMAVVFIIGLLVGIVGVGVNSKIKRARVEATRAQISSLEQAISMFHLECGFYPDALESLVNPPASGRPCKGYPPEGFLSKKELPSDAWSRPFSYAQPGTRNRDSYDLFSGGPDAEEGTADDIGNWSAEAAEEQ